MAEVPISVPTTFVWLLQRYGRCEPRGSGAADLTIATVVKAPDGDGLLGDVSGDR